MSTIDGRPTGQKRSASAYGAVVTIHTPEARRLRADAERNRERILSAAAEVFASAGLEATLHDVADRAGVGVGTVYRRFPDKEALLGALFDDKLRSVIDLAARACSNPDAWAGLVDLLRSLGGLQSKNRGLHEVLNGSVYCQDRVAVARSQFEPLVQRVLSRAQADGYVRADLEPTDLTVILLMLGSVAQCTQDASPVLWERYLDLVLEGLRARPDHSSIPCRPGIACAAERDASSALGSPQERQLK
jgi:AcrR family transcriptional regulator